MAREYHPYSQYMTSDGYSIYALSIHDILIDIKGMYFPIRSLSYQKNMNVTEEHGSGSHDPFALVDQEHTYSGTFSYAGYLVNGQPLLTTAETLALEAALEDQNDEGQPRYFNIFVMEVPGNRTIDRESSEYPEYGQPVVPTKATSGRGGRFIEALIDCKLTKSGRNYVEKGTVVTERDFKFARRIPR